MDVEVHLKETSQTVKHTKVANSYTKGDLYCVYEGDKVFKYPVINIWRVVESYK